MKIAILGAGGIGGYYGGLLAQSGQDVAFIARGRHLEAIRKHGLRVESVHGDFVIRPALATDDPAEVGTVDLILVTVKSYDLEEAAKSALPLIGPATLALPLLNGLDAAERLASVLGKQHVLAGLTHISSSIVAPGIIRQISPVRRITFSPYKRAAGEDPVPRSEATPPSLEQVREVLAASGVQAVLSPSVDVALWEKFILMASIGGVCCIARQPMGSVLSTPETRQIYTEALQEVEAVGRARGIALPRDIVERSLQLTAGFAPETKPSTLLDLEAGRRLELEALNGAAVRYGLDAKVPTPVHRVIYAALKPNAG